MNENNENTQHADLFCPKCGENIISMSVHYCATPPAERPPQCGTCDGSSAVDSGGVTPCGQGIEVECPECKVKRERPTPETDEMASMRRATHEWIWLCSRLERERNDAIEEVARMRNFATINGVADLERQLAEAREQRDRMAEALEGLLDNTEDIVPLGGLGDQARSALASLKGNTDESR